MATLDEAERARNHLLWVLNPAATRINLRGVEVGEDAEDDWRLFLRVVVEKDTPEVRESIPRIFDNVPVRVEGERAVPSQSSDPNDQARKELDTMLTALHRDRDQFFAVGTFACKKKLANGAVVRFSIVQPSRRQT